MREFDIILVMNCLRTYRAKIYSKDLKVTLNDEKGWEVCFYGQRDEKPYFVILAIKASKLLCQGCIGYWCYAMDTQKKEEIIEDILLVCEFKDVSLKSY